MRVTGIAICVALILATCGDSSAGVLPPANIRITHYYQLNNEEQVFICPTDSSIIIANWRDFRLGYRQIGVGRSTNGGLTWQDSLIPPEMQYFSTMSQQSDPTMTVDRSGNFYMSALDYLPAGGPNSSVISFYKSTDKGVSWSGPYATPPAPNSSFEDKQYITVDRTGGPHDGTLYCAWARFYGGSSGDRILFIRSSNVDLGFSDTVAIRPVINSAACGISDWSAGQFANPIVSSDGAVHVFWMGYVIDSLNGCNSYSGINQRTSYDGGVTFQPERPLVPVEGYMTANGGINTYSAPIGDADISASPFRGNMYIAYADIGPEDVGHSDIDVIRSTDNGQTWSPRQQINDDANSSAIDNFHPWLVVNEDGVVVVVFYDQRYDPAHYNFDLSAAYSYDGGLTYTTNHRISTVSSSPGALRMAPRPTGDPYQVPLSMMDPQAGRIGEYIGVTAFHDKVNAVWTDTRDGNQEVYTANWYLPLLEPRLLSPANGGICDSSTQLRWATSWKHNADHYRVELSPTADFSTSTVYETDTTFWNGALSIPGVGALPDGSYFWRVKAFKKDGSDSSGYSPVYTFILDTAPPTAPVLVSPADGAFLATYKPLFDWSVSTDANPPVTYDLYVSSDASYPPSPITQIFSGLTASQYQMATSLGVGTFYWRVVAKDAIGNSATSESWSFTTSCCQGVTGNVNMIGIVDVSDLSLLVSYLTSSPPPALPCLGEANVNAAGIVDVSDLSLLVAYLTSSPAPTLPNCP